MRIRGHAGALRVGGRLAATLGRWTYEGTPEGWTVLARLVSRDEHWLRSRGAFLLTIEVGKGHWRWRGVRIQIEGANVRVGGSGPPTL